VSVAWAAGALALLSALEALAPLRSRRERWTRHAARNVATFALAAAVGLPLRLAVVLPLSARVQSEGWGLLPAMPGAGWVKLAAGFVLLDASLWLWHVLNHRVPLLWRFHAAHHADLDLDATTALRFHFGEIALSAAWRSAQVIAFGIGPGLLVAWEAATAVATLVHHANLRLPRRLDAALGMLVATPRLHGIHHSIVREERDSNFAVILTAWDVLARTRRTAVPQDGLTIGLPELQDARAVTFGRVQALPFHGLMSEAEPAERS
jgi:sterol desaturase/sphingolipid hydroxylase (fatty acid hydroxylase superfamily)